MRRIARRRSTIQKVTQCLAAPTGKLRRLVAPYPCFQQSSWTKERRRQVQLGRPGRDLVTDLRQQLGRFATDRRWDRWQLELLLAQRRSQQFEQRQQFALREAALSAHP